MKLSDKAMQIGEKYSKHFAENLAREIDAHTAAAVAEARAEEREAAKGVRDELEELRKYNSELDQLAHYASKLVSVGGDYWLIKIKRWFEAPAAHDSATQTERKG